VDPAISRAYYAFPQPPHDADRRPESRSAVVQSEDHAASKGIIPVEEMERPEAHLDRVFGPANDCSSTLQRREDVRSTEGLRDADTGEWDVLMGAGRIAGGDVPSRQRELQPPNIWLNVFHISFVAIMILEVHKIGSRLFLFSFLSNQKEKCNAD